MGGVGDRSTARDLGGGQGKDRPQPHRDTETSEAICWKGPITGRVSQFQGVFSVFLGKSWRHECDTLVLQPQRLDTEKAQGVQNLAPFSLVRGQVIAAPMFHMRQRP